MQCCAVFIQLQSPSCVVHTHCWHAVLKSWLSTGDFTLKTAALAQRWLGVQASECETKWTVFSVDDQRATSQSRTALLGVQASECETEWTVFSVDEQCATSQSRTALLARTQCKLSAAVIGTEPVKIAPRTSSRVGWATVTTTALKSRVQPVHGYD